MSTISVIAGSLKGKKLLFKNEKFDNADITPQKVKGALFSMLGENLNGKSFFDLFSCSGQIGIEALSRGAYPVIFNEQDKKRFSFIKKTIDSFQLNHNAYCLNSHYKQALSYVKKKWGLVDYIFIDPPYNKNSDSFDRYEEIFLKIEKTKILAEDGCIVIQCFSKNVPSENIFSFNLIQQKTYGNSILAVYIYLLK